MKKIHNNLKDSVETGRKMCYDNSIKKKLYFFDQGALNDGYEKTL